MNPEHEKKRSAAIAYINARKLSVLEGKVSWNPAAVDVRATIARAKSRANLKNLRGVK